MAIIDTEKNTVVIRIVFDGSPLSGKTTTIYALRDALTPSSEVFPPDGDTDTTLYFDWLEYTGGQFQQMPITCQIVSTPSQANLNARRQYLLNTADVVIFVIDAADNDQQTALEYYADVQTIQAENGSKALILANKQDKKDVINDELAYLYQTDDDVETKIVQASALKNQGIRESFVLAVRLASERLETLQAQGDSLDQQPSEKTASELLSAIQQLEHEEPNDISLSTSELEALADLSAEPILETLTPTASTPDLTDTQIQALANLDDDVLLPEIDADSEIVATSELSEPESDGSIEPIDSLEDSALVTIANLAQDPIDDLPSIETAADVEINEPVKSQRLPRFPDEETPYQWVYPPLLGRNILAKPDFQRGLRPSLDDETWMIHLDGQWRCFSNLDWEYPTEQAARQALREQTAWHVQCNPLLMKQRCVAIAQERKTWRLWQITQAPTHLAEQLTEALLLTDVNQLVVETFTCATCYLDAYQELSQLPFEFQVQLDNVEVHEKHIAYLGVIYGEKSSATDNYLGSNDAIKQVLKQGFTSIVQQAVRTEDLDVEAIVSELEAVQTQDDNLIVVESLAELFVEAI
ncbi:GTPase domain-containing protein [Candidatus Albibeggiatoa sp. nov. BB20]|uniref:GTPase domain-containing protein n=1 Tax=Candidatus Albibeggiatoa sp. nov. BB20 TaxID=3162723 RepID=UPI003365AE04